MERESAYWDEAWSLPPLGIGIALDASDPNGLFGPNGLDGDDVDYGCVRAWTRDVETARYQRVCRMRGRAARERPGLVERTSGVAALVCSAPWGSPFLRFCGGVWSVLPRERARV